MAQPFKRLLFLFFPSWRLFDSPKDQAILFFKHIDSNDWIKIERPNRKWTFFHFFLNTDDTKWLYLFSLIDKLAYEITANHSNYLSALAQANSTKEIDLISGFLFTQNLVRYGSIDFKLVILDSNKNKTQAEFKKVIHES